MRLQTHAETSPPTSTCHLSTLRILFSNQSHRWDDWVPQDRLRKLTEENQELARNLRKEMDAQRRAAPKPVLTSTRKRPFGSELNPASSTRGSEERGSVAATNPPSRGTKRGREYEGIDKVRSNGFSCSPHLSPFPSVKSSSSSPPHIRDWRW